MFKKLSKPVTRMCNVTVYPAEVVLWTTARNPQNNNNNNVMEFGKVVHGPWSMVHGT